EDIAAAILERLQLLAERGAGFVEARRTKGLETTSQWPYCSSDQQVVFGALARDFRRGAVDLGDLRLKTVLRQFDAAGSEGVGLQDFGARFSVRLVYVAHEIGRAQVQLIVALVDEHAFVVELRAHRAIEDD